MGEFNTHDIYRSPLFTAITYGMSFGETVYDSNPYQLTMEPTHMNDNILDLLFTDDLDNISNLHNDPTIFPMSDHYVISLLLSHFHHRHVTPIKFMLPTTSHLLTSKGQITLSVVLF